MVPLKARYMGKDLERLAEYYQIPLSPPAVSDVVDLTHIYDMFDSYRILLRLCL